MNKYLVKAGVDNDITFVEMVEADDIETALELAHLHASFEYNRQRHDLGLKSYYDIKYEIAERKYYGDESQVRYEEARDEYRKEVETHLTYYAFPY